MAGMEQSSPLVREGLEHPPPSYAKTPENQEIDSRNQVLFAEAVRGLISDSVLPLPDAGDSFNHRGGRTLAAKSAFDSGHDALFLHRSFNTVAGDEFSFTPHPLRRIGNEDSRRQVFFGQLSGIKNTDSTDDNVEVAIAMIPETQDFMRHEQAIHEVAMYDHVATNDIPTLGVVGVLRSSSPEVYGFTVTQYEPNIRMLDGLDWTNMSDKEIHDSLQYAVDTLAWLHTSYIFHGDAAFRNIAVSDIKEFPVIVDLELSGSLQQDADDIMKLSRWMSGDFSSLAMSLDLNLSHKYQDEVGIQSPTDRFDFMYHTIFAPYRDRLFELGVKNDDPLWKAYDNVVSRRLSEAAGEEGYWKHF